MSHGELSGGPCVSFHVMRQCHCCLSMRFIKGGNDCGLIVVKRLRLTTSMRICGHECVVDAMLSYLFKTSISTHCT